METLVVVDQHRNQYYNKSDRHDSVCFWPFASSPAGSFREINCRTFHTGSGILPTPFKSHSTPITKRSRSSSVSFSPKTPSPSVNYPDGQKNRIRSARSIAIPIDIKLGSGSRKEYTSLNGDFHFSERWAGPTYSNSPPPSSLPIPKFSLKPKRSVSLDLPTSISVVDFHPVALSAPTSPTRDWSHSPRDLFDHDDSATKTLRRILNLDLTDD